MKAPSGFPNLSVRLLVFQSIRAGCLPVDMCPEGVQFVAWAVDSGPVRPPPLLFDRLRQVLLYFVIRSAAPALNYVPTLPTPSPARYPRRPWKWPDLCGCWPSPCAAGTASLGIRPELCGPCPLLGCRRMRGPVAVILRFSIHLPLCSTDFRQLHRSYEEIRLLRKHQVVVVSFSDPTAKADLRSSLEVRMTNVLPPPSPILF